MPILAAEPESYPSGLWEPDSTYKDQADSRWWCLHTKPRQEKSTARDLYNQRLTYYLPQAVREDYTPQGRKTRSIVPFFPSYLFLFGDARARALAFRGNRLVSVLEVVDQATLENDLRQINRMLHSGLSLASAEAVAIGSRVRILTGPLEGIEGTVIRRGNRDQFVAVVNFLRQGAVVDLQDWQVEKI